MAEITNTKKNPRIDMTAMVDVAFLLLSFFVLSSQINQQSTMELTLPECTALEGCNSPISEEKMLTIHINDGDSLSYYLGADSDAEKASNYSAEGIRRVLLSHVNRKSNLCSSGETDSCWDPIILVKIHPRASYKAMVDILDELAIVKAPKYSVVDLEEENL